ncbi:MAG: PASTA domain-containing protein [Clostridia bacterium]|nr:PASTA domain-containing protein [Clostridia bacterium]
MAKKSISTSAVKRSTVLGIIILAVFLVLLIRILLVQTVDFKKYQKKVLDQITTETPIPANRGKIYDRNGKVLATNITTYRVFVSPSGVKSAQSEVEKGDPTDYRDLISRGLSELLDGVTYDKVHHELTEYSNKLDRTISKKVDEETADKVRAFINEHGLGTMIYLEAQNTRYYPGGTLAAHAIGFTSDDGIGLYGLEYQYNQYLKGVDGYYVTARDSYGNVMPFDYANCIEAVDGYDLTTTIDATIQTYLEEQLAATATNHVAMNRAAGIVMDIKTGAVLAMAVSSPFDLNNPRTMSEATKKLLETSGYEAGSDEYSKYQMELLTGTWSNKAVTESYIPGSTFKIITTAMALEERESEIPSSVLCPGHKTVLGQKIHCHQLKGHGSLNLSEGLQQSCNVWFMTLGELIGIDTYNQYVKAFGYKEKTGIDLPGEGSGLFIDPSLMTELDLAIYAFGQNFNVTPLQQISAISAVANDGVLMTPYLVEKITDKAGNTIYRHKTEVKRTVVSKEVCDTISEMLEEGVSGNGGAKNAYVAGYRVAAKTGTSEKKDTGHSTVSVENYVGMSLGEAKAALEAAGLRTEAVGIKSDDAVILSQNPKANTKMVKENGVVILYTKADASSPVTMPKLRGMTLERAKATLAELGLNFVIEGTGIYGTVKDQSVTEGRIVTRGDVITLSFPEAYVCSTVAFAPADDPQVAILIMVDDPQKGAYGSTVAAPYVGATLKNILPYLGVEPIYTPEEEAKLAQKVGSYRSWSVNKATESIKKSGLSYEIIGTAGEDAIVKAQSPASGSLVQKETGKIILYVGDATPTESVQMPDLVGKNATLANGLLMQYDLNVKIEGSRGADAEVYEQSVAPGTMVKPGTVITLKFRSMVADDYLE